MALNFVTNLNWRMKSMPAIYGFWNSTLNCLISECSLITLQKCFFNFFWLVGSLNFPVFKWGISYVMSFKKEMIIQQNPRKGHAIPIKNISVQNAATVWMNAATKYPNGVFQSNGNLFIFQFVAFLMRTK